MTNNDFSNQDLYKEEEKLSDTFFKVSKLFLGLMEKPMDYQEMSDFLNEKDCPCEFSTEILNKYINTLRALGLQIEKVKNKFQLFNFLIQIELNEEEITTFKNIEKSILQYGTDKNIQTFLNIKRKILKYFDLNTQSKINCYSEQNLITEIGLLVKQFEKICNDGLKIVIEYEGEILTVEPQNICQKDNNIFLTCINLKDLKTNKLLLKRINLIEQQPSKIFSDRYPNTVIYELSGKLTSTYKLKDNEEIIEKQRNKLIIKCKNEDYEFLSKRLIRYQNFCKVTYPEEFKNYFINYIDRILNIYK